MFKEFKEFIAGGNAFDLAVGVILGAALGVVVTSLVDDVLRQIIGASVGKPSFDAISIHWGDELSVEKAQPILDQHPGLGKAYEHQIFLGTFITKIILLLIIGLVLFVLVKAVNKMRRPKAAAPAGPSEVELLTEIRDALKAR
jgi:large conductance mechanosensitive channel